MRRRWVGAIVVASVLVAASAQVVVAAASSAVVQSAIDDVQAFWATQLPTVYGMEYTRIPQNRLFPYSQASPPPACGGSGTTPYKDVANNAFYCPSGDFLAWDTQGLIPTIQQQFGDFAVALVAAHELGHAIQERTGTSAGSTIPLELQADCFAGAWAQHATATTNDAFNVTKADLDEALSGYLYFRDPPGTDPTTEGAHGSAFDRIAAFNDGFSGGVRRCKNYDTQPPTVTEIPYTSSNDLAGEGNLPFGDLVKLAQTDLNAYWRSLLGSTPVTSFAADAAKTKRCAKGDSRPVATCSDGTVAYNTTKLRAAYDKYGDNAAATLMAEAWADAATLKGKLPITRAPQQRAAECMAGAWAGNLVNATRKTDATLSPGDLDEAVSTLIAYPGRKTTSNDSFVRFRAFQTGFTDGAAACGLKTKT
jgi:predicted metalloprotease